MSQTSIRTIGVKTSVVRGSVGATTETEIADMDGKLTTSLLFQKVVPTTFPTYVHFSGKTTLLGRMTVYAAK